MQNAGVTFQKWGIYMAQRTVGTPKYDTCSMRTGMPMISPNLRGIPKLCHTQSTPQIHSSLFFCTCMFFNFTAQCIWPSTFTALPSLNLKSVGSQWDWQVLRPHWFQTGPPFWLCLKMEYLNSETMWNVWLTNGFRGWMGMGMDGFRATSLFSEKPIGKWYWELGTIPCKDCCSGLPCLTILGSQLKLNYPAQGYGYHTRSIFPWSWRSEWFIIQIHSWSARVTKTPKIVCVNTRCPNPQQNQSLAFLHRNCNRNRFVEHKRGLLSELATGRPKWRNLQPLGKSSGFGGFMANTPSCL